MSNTVEDKFLRLINDMGFALAKYRRENPREPSIVRMNESDLVTMKGTAFSVSRPYFTPHFLNGGKHDELFGLKVIVDRRLEPGEFKFEYEPNWKLAPIEDSRFTGRRR